MFTLPDTIIVPREFFKGTWNAKYWKNTPGPFYSTTENLMSLLALNEDPHHLLYDEHCEFIWRQPITSEDFSRCISAMSRDEVSSYQIDGNDHWTSDSVRDWWQRRGELVDWCNQHLSRPVRDQTRFLHGDPNSTAPDLVLAYLRYLDGGISNYLRQYLFWLENQRLPNQGESVPDL